MAKHKITVNLNSNGDYWQAVWYDGHGKRSTRSLGPKASLSKRQAKLECNTIATDLAAKITLPGDTPKLADWYATYMAEKNYNDSTRLVYEDAWRYLQGLGADDKLADITRDTASKWLARLREDNPQLSESSIRKHIRAGRAIFNEAVERDLLRKNPLGHLTATPPDIDKDWRYITMAELDALLDASPDDEWRKLLGLFRLAGLRRKEAFRLTWGDVDMERRRLIVRHTGEKTTKARTRVVPIVPKLLEILTGNDSSEKVVDKGVNNLIRDFQVIVKAAGLEPWEKSFHTLRKNFETDLLESYPIADVASILGNSPTVALKHYHQVKDSTLQTIATGDTRIAQLEREHDRLCLEASKTADLVEVLVARFRKLGPSDHGSERLIAEVMMQLDRLCPNQTAPKSPQNAA